MALTRITDRQVTYKQGAAGSVVRGLGDKLRESVSVKDFGAVGDGVTDDTAAIQAALDNVSNIGMLNGGAKIVFPPGIYLCNIHLIGTLNNSMGEYGICLSGYGATLKGRIGDKSIIRGNGWLPNIADPLAGGSSYINGTRIEGFTFDMTNMQGNDESAIGVHRMYNSTIVDIHVIQANRGLVLGCQCYTVTVINLNCGVVDIIGHDGINLNTSCTFTGLVANQVNLKYVFSISFFGGAIQGGIPHFNMITDCQAITIIGMDLESINNAPVYTLGPNCKYITSIGNQITGNTVDNYTSGFAPNSNFSDRPPITAGINNVGIYGRAASQAKVFISTTPLPIYKFLDSSQPTALVLVTGDNGYDGFQDLIMVFHSFVTIIKSQNLYGSPPTRIYNSDVGSKSLLMSVSSGTYNIRPVLLEFLMSSA